MSSIDPALPASRVQTLEQVVAGSMPARAASRVDPLVVLRDE